MAGTDIVVYRVGVNSKNRVESVDVTASPYERLSRIMTSSFGVNPCS